MTRFSTRPLRRRAITLVMVGAVLAGLLSACGGSVPAAPAAVPVALIWPQGGEWAQARAEDQGLDPGPLLAMFDDIDANQYDLHSVLIIRNGYLVLEAYFHPYHAEIPHEVRSVTKSVTSALVGIALRQHDLANLDQRLLEFFPQRAIQNRDANKDAITLAHLLTMTSGYEWPDDDNLATQLMIQRRDWVQFVLDAPMQDPPGARFKYNNGTAVLVGAALAAATGQNPADYAAEWLFGPLGITDYYWESAPDGLSNTGWGLYLTPRDMAKLGYLYLRNGEWDGQQVVPPDWVRASTQDQIGVSPVGYGYLWWVHSEAGYYQAVGTGGQHIIVVPQDDLVVVFTGSLVVPGGTPPLPRLVEQYIIPAARASGDVDAAKSDALAARVTTLAQPRGVALAPLPPLAARVNGQDYRLGNNTLGMQSLALTFTPGASTAGLALNGGPPLPVGLDGVYRVTDTGRELLALRGRWESDTTFSIDLRPLGTADAWQLRLAVDRAAPDTLSLTLIEGVAGFNETVRGQAR